MKNARDIFDAEKSVVSNVASLFDSTNGFHSTILSCLPCSFRKVWRPRGKSGAGLYIQLESVCYCTSFSSRGMMTALSSYELYKYSSIEWTVRNLGCGADDHSL